MAGSIRLEMFYSQARGNESFCIPLLRKAAKDLHINEVAVAGGVSANSGLREAFLDHAKRYGWKVHIPKFSFTTDNAAMVAITGYYKYMDKEFCPMDAAPFSRVVL